MSQIQIHCPKHSKQIEYFCMNNSCSECRLFCFDCVRQGTHSSHPKDWEKMSLLKERFLIPQSKEWMEVVDSLGHLQGQINKFLNKLKGVLIEKFVLSLEKLRVMNPHQMNDLVTELFKCQLEKQSMLSTIKQNTQNLIESLKCFIEDNQIQENSVCSIQSNIIDQNENLIQIYQNDQYEILNSFGNDNCLAICFNQDSTIMVAGYKNSKIKLFEFEQGQFKFQKKLKEHKRDVLCLQFMRNSASFVSGSADTFILIWVQDRIGEWSFKKLCGHNKDVSCLLVNKSEDLIITGSADKTIKFWVKDESWKYSFTLNQHKGFIRSISLNENENKLISCALDDNQILVSRRKTKNEWEVIQEIEQGAQRLCFINNYLFAVQERLAKHMCVYEFNNLNNNFILKDTVQVKSGENCEWLFPQQYISQKKIIVSKNGSYINIIKVNQNFELESLQSINFNTHKIFGRVTNDGQYLVTWDKISKSFQVRIFKQ